MSALAQPWPAGPFAVAPARVSAGSRRSGVAWNEPEPWIVAVLLLTGVAVIGRHPLARMLGTEVDTTAVAPTVVATGAPVPAPAATSSSAAAAAMAAVPTHEPRDPFHALVGASGAVLAPGAPAATAPSTTGSGTLAAARPAHQPAAVATTSCTGTTYKVVAGDSLWSVAARTVKSSDVSRVTVAWHRIYNANRPPLGANPSLLPVGTTLCLPQSL